jgi:hypothetical protein
MTSSQHTLSCVPAPLQQRLTRLATLPVYQIRVGRGLGLGLVQHGSPGAQLQRAPTCAAMRARSQRAPAVFRTIRKAGSPATTGPSPARRHCLPRAHARRHATVSASGPHAGLATRRPPAVYEAPRAQGRGPRPGCRPARGGQQPGRPLARSGGTAQRRRLERGSARAGAGAPWGWRGAARGRRGARLGAAGRERAVKRERAGVVHEDDVRGRPAALCQHMLQRGAQLAHMQRRAREHGDHHRQQAPALVAARLPAHPAPMLARATRTAGECGWSRPGGAVLHARAGAPRACTDTAPARDGAYLECHCFALCRTPWMRAGRAAHATTRTGTTGCRRAKSKRRRGFCGRVATCAQSKCDHGWVAGRSHAGRSHCARAACRPSRAAPSTAFLTAGLCAWACTRCSAAPHPQRRGCGTRTCPVTRPVGRAKVGRAAAPQKRVGQQRGPRARLAGGRAPGELPHGRVRRRRGRADGRPERARLASVVAQDRDALERGQPQALRERQAALPADVQQAVLQRHQALAGGHRRVRARVAARLRPRRSSCGCMPAGGAQPCVGAAERLCLQSCGPRTAPGAPPSRLRPRPPPCTPAHARGALARGPVRQREPARARAHSGAAAPPAAPTGALTALPPRANGPGQGAPLQRDQARRGKSRYTGAPRRRDCKQPWHPSKAGLTGACARRCTAGRPVRPGPAGLPPATSNELAAELHSLARPASAPRPTRMHCCRRSRALLSQTRLPGAAYQRAGGWTPLVAPYSSS